MQLSPVIEKVGIDQSKTDSDSFIENRITEEWLNTEEAAQYLRISPKCLLNLVSNGKIPHYKFGRRNRYLERELKKVLLANPRGGSHGL